MTQNSSGYSIPAVKPDAVALRRAELGGWILEVMVGGERKSAAFATEAQAVQVFVALMVGKQVVEAAASPAQEPIKARKKPGPKPGSKRKPKAVAETPVAEEQLAQAA